MTIDCWDAVCGTTCYSIIGQAGPQLLLPMLLLCAIPFRHYVRRILYDCTWSCERKREIAPYLDDTDVISEEKSWKRKEKPFRSLYVTSLLKY